MQMTANVSRTLTANVFFGASLIFSCILLAPASAWAAAVHTFNFSGTGATDMGVYKLSRFWYFKVSQSTLASYPFGADGDVPIPADYDGDGKTDFAAYRPSTREFRWDRSSDGVFNSIVMGNWGDIPIVADFDGDGRTDLIIFRPGTAQYWYYQSSNGGLARVDAGNPGDLPIIGDFDGDGVDEPAVFNPATATFAYSPSGGGANVTRQVGQAGDTPLAGDFDGDGKADPAAYHSPTSTFTYRRSSDGVVVSQQWGQYGDIPLSGDYDGDGKTDLSVFHPQPGSYNIFYYRSSATLQTVANNFGDPHDIPLGMRYEPAEQPSSLSYTAIPYAPQIMYQSGVPHTDKNGAMRTAVDANSFFPRCIYEAMAGTLADMRDAGFNCLKPYNGWSVLPMLQEAQQANLQVVRQMLICPSNTAVCNSPGQPEPTAAQQMQSYINELNTDYIPPDPNHHPIHTHPNILAWYIEEEPTGCVYTSNDNCVERYDDMTQFAADIKLIDAYHPTFLLDVTLPSPLPFEDTNYPWWSSWATHPASDIVSVDDYPFVSGAESTLEKSAGYYNWLGWLNLNGKPMWITPQLFAQHPPNTFTWTMPTPTQMRAEVFTALVHGATGIFYFAVDSWAVRNAQVIGIGPAIPASYSNANPGDAVATSTDAIASAALWNATVSMNKELASLDKVILSPTSTLSYQVEYSGTPVTSTPIRTLLKKSPTGVYTLLVVNIDNVPLNLRVTLPARPYELFSINPDGARGPMGPYGSAFTDSIEGFGVRKYEFK
jgi:hypothetical protein